MTWGKNYVAFVLLASKPNAIEIHIVNYISYFVQNIAYNQKLRAFGQKTLRIQVPHSVRLVAARLGL